MQKVLVITTLAAFLSAPAPAQKIEPDLDPHGKTLAAAAREVGSMGRVQLARLADTVASCSAAIGTDPAGAGWMLCHQQIVRYTLEYADTDNLNVFLTAMLLEQGDIAELQRTASADLHQQANWRGNVVVSALNVVTEAVRARYRALSKG